MPTNSRIKKIHRSSRTLSSGRPPTANRAKPTLSKQATQKLIRSHHQLNKRLAEAQADGDEAKTTELERQIAEVGGLKSYQLASIHGQSSERGGDSSKVLLEWLEDLKPQLVKLNWKIRMLEVGALSTENACSKSRLFDIERIDLHSQGEGIRQQDFMYRPLPKSDEQRFDIISLSLVLNFVPSAEGRGEMLERTCLFLDLQAASTRPDTIQETFPALFLVLPAACLVNSRYMTEQRLTQLMASLGYAMMKRKQTAKLIYLLWTLHEPLKTTQAQFPKKEVNPGKNRNNFCIVRTI